MMLTKGFGCEISLIVYRAGGAGWNVSINQLSEQLNLVATSLPPQMACQILAALKFAPA
jgi:hypothetical protein